MIGSIVKRYELGYIILVKYRRLKTGHQLKL
jgi:hypothetical protein